MFFSHIPKRIQIIFVLFLLGGTCLLMGLMWRQNDSLERLYEQSLSCVAGFGFEESDTISYLRENGQESSSWFANMIPVFAYLSGSSGELSAESSQEIQDFALLYPGKNSKGIWSGAAGHYSRGQMLFQELEQTEEDTDSEDVVETAVELEGDTETISAALEENETYTKEQQDTEETEEKETKGEEKKIQYLKSSQSLSYLLKNFYIVDSSTSIDKKIFDVDTLLHTSVTMKKKSEPQILIYHTHGGSEYFADSQVGEKQESVIGIGSVLEEILTKQYGYQVIHDETQYDKINGKTDRSKAYNKANAGIRKILKKYPSIQVVIDLHRDGVGNKVRRITTINGKKTALIMFFNGLSRNRKGDISYLKNDNLQANLAFSLQMKMKCMELYPNLAKPVYLKSYRYNLHLRKKSLLIELGNENNTLEEAKNAMPPLAKVLDQVLSGK